MAKEDEENSVSLSLCDKINTEAESLTFLTGLTGLTRLGNESLLCDEIFLTQRGKGAEGQRPHLYNSPSSLLSKGNNFFETTFLLRTGELARVHPL